MLQRQTFKVQLPDREYEVTVDGRDYMHYERESGKSVVELLQSDTQFVQWYTLAAAGSRRQGLFDGTPEEFYEQVEYVLPVMDGAGEAKEGAADPDPPTDTQQEALAS